MGSFSTRTKTKSTSTSTPLDQYAPYITKGLTSAQDVFDKQQPQLQQIGQQANDVYKGLAAPNQALGSIYSGTNPAQAAYAGLTKAGASDPSMGTLAHLAEGSHSPGQYDGIGASVNGDTSQFYKDTLSGKYLNNNPYLDAITQQGTDAALKAVNQRFGAAGLGAGISTPYTDVASKSITDANNTLRYGAYNNELNRMGQIGGQSDAEYNATGQLKLGAQQAKDAAFNNDRSAQLAAAQGLGSQYNANNNTALNATNSSVQSILAGLGLAPGMANAQLNALGASATLPFAGTSAYASLINGLTAKYGNQSGTSTSSSTPGLGAVAAGLGGSALAGWASGGFG